MVQTALESPIGSVLAGRYRVEALLGEGGMARVFRVRHAVIGKVFAAKILRAEHREHAGMGRRFVREAQLLSEVEHSNVISIVDFGRTEDGDAFYIMEYLAGSSLADRIDTQGALPCREALDDVALIADALAAVHDLGAVHRDLNPQNIMLLDRPERIKLIDFGIAHVGPRLTAPGISLGTPEYMAPEQIAGQEPDARADLYALGLTLFEALTGVSPFLGPTVGDTLQNQLHRSAPTLAALAPSLAGLQETQRLLDILLDKDPERRPGSAAEVARRVQLAITVDLDKVRSDTLVLGSTLRTTQRRSRPSRRRLWLSALAAALTLGFLGGSIAAVSGGGSQVLESAGLAQIPMPPPAPGLPAEPPPADPPSQQWTTDPLAPEQSRTPLTAVNAEQRPNPPDARGNTPRRRSTGKRKLRTRPPGATPEDTKRRLPSDRPKAGKKDAWDLRDPFG